MYIEKQLFGINFVADVIRRGIVFCFFVFLQYELL